MSIFNKPLLWTIIIFICAAIFRLTNLDLIEFKLDEARDVYEMEKFYQSPYFIQRGTIQSTGVYNPPLWYYFLALISLHSRDPQYLSFMIGLINCAAVVGFYLVVRKFYGSAIHPGGVKAHPRGVAWFGVAEIAGLLMAFSPWMIIFSRKIWAPDLIFPLVVVWFYFINYLVWQPESTPRVSKVSKWLGLVATLGLLVQLHASGIFLALATLIMLAVVHLRGVRAHPGGVLLSRLKVHLGGVLIGLLISLIPLFPYLLYQFQNGCPDCQAYFAYQEGEALGAQPTFDSNAFLRPFQFINGSGFDDALGEEGLMQFLEEKPVVGIFSFLFLLEFLLLPVGVISLFSGTPGRSQSPPSRWPMLAIFAAVPVLVFLTKTAAHLYYFLIVSPIVILIYSLGIFHPWGVSLDFARDKRAHPRGGLKWIPTFVGMTVVVINIIFTFSFYQFLGEVRVVKGDYGVTFGVLKEQTPQNLDPLNKALYWVNLFNE